MQVSISSLTHTLTQNDAEENLQTEVTLHSYGPTAEMTLYN